MRCDAEVEKRNVFMTEHLCREAAGILVWLLQGTVRVVRRAGRGERDVIEIPYSVRDAVGQKQQEIEGWGLSTTLRGRRSTSDARHPSRFYSMY